MKLAKRACESSQQPVWQVLSTPPSQTFLLRPQHSRRRKRITISGGEGIASLLMDEELAAELNVARVTWARGGAASTSAP